MRKDIVLCLSIVMLGSVFALRASPSQAQTCGPYGNETCPSSKIAIDKKVFNPITRNFDENLTGGAAYGPSAEVTFRLKVTNTGTTDFATVRVTDTLPEKMTKPRLASTDNIFDVVTGKNSDGHETITFTLKDLKAGQSRDNIDILADTLSASSYTAGETTCMDNVARAEADGQSNEDKAQVCVKVDVLGVTTLPQAGPADFLPLLPFVGMGITGMVLALRRS